MSTDSIHDKQVVVFILAIVLFSVAIITLLIVLFLLRRHQKQIDAKLFNFSQTNRSKYADDSFIDNKIA